MRLKRHGWLGLLLLTAIALVFLADSRVAVRQRARDAQVATATRDMLPAASRVARPHGPGVAGEVRGTDASESEDPQLARCLADYQAAVTVRIGQLGAMPEPRARLAHAMLGPLAGDTRVPVGEAFEARWRESSRLIEAVANLDPQDTLIAWTHANRCMDRRGCNAERAHARLQQLEPRNAASWMPGIRHAIARGDHRRAEALLARAGAATYYDDHAHDSIRMLADVLGDLPLPPACLAAQDALDAHVGLARRVTADDMVLVTAWGIALAQSATIGPQRICDRADTMAPHLREHCVAVYTRMAQSGSLLSSSIGAARMAEFTAGLPEGAQWRERLRDLYWLQEYMGSASLAGDFDPRELTEHGELRYWQARLQAEGRWPAPPGWLPEQPERRAMVLTGRRPRH